MNLRMYQMDGVGSWSTGQTDDDGGEGLTWIGFLLKTKRRGGGSRTAHDLQATDRHQSPRSGARTFPDKGQNTGRMSISPRLTACLPCSTSTSPG